MALVYRCDRCGNQVSLKNAYVMTMSDRMSNEVGRQWDLCVTCKNTMTQPFDSAKSRTA